MTQLFFHPHTFSRKHNLHFPMFSIMHDMGEKEMIRPPGVGFDAFLDFLGRPDRRLVIHSPPPGQHTAVTAASAEPSRQHDSSLPSSSSAVMRTKRNNKSGGGVVVVGHKPGPRSPTPRPAKKTHGHGGPAMDLVVTLLLLLPPPRQRESSNSIGS